MHLWNISALDYKRINCGIFAFCIDAKSGEILAREWNMEAQYQRQEEMGALQEESVWVSHECNEYAANQSANDSLEKWTIQKQKRTFRKPQTCSDLLRKGHLAKVNMHRMNIQKKSTIVWLLEWAPHQSSTWVQSGGNGGLWACPLRLSIHPMWGLEDRKPATSIVVLGTAGQGTVQVWRKRSPQARFFDDMKRKYVLNKDLKTLMSRKRASRSRKVLSAHPNKRSTQTLTEKIAAGALFRQPDRSRPERGLRQGSRPCKPSCFFPSEVYRSSPARFRLFRESLAFFHGSML